MSKTDCIALLRYSPISRLVMNSWGKLLRYVQTKEKISCHTELYMIK